MDFPENADVFKYLDGLKAVNTNPEQYVYRLTKRFEIPSDRAEAYVLSWVDAEYLQHNHDINDWYQDELQDLKERYFRKLEDMTSEKAVKVAKFDLRQVMLKK